MEKKLFQVCVISNNLDEYKACQNSFYGAGFYEKSCLYTLYDNSKSNSHDPFKIIPCVVNASDCKYVIVCHQDVRADRLDGFEHLAMRLAELCRRDNTWAIAGNVGVTRHGYMVGRISDPISRVDSSNLPRKVISLDENFLVFKARHPISCSLGLSGFHMYGADLCLNAMESGFSAYAIDFHVTHLSAGNPQSQEFLNAVQAFKSAWNSRFVCGIVSTTCTEMYLSRWQIVRKLMEFPRTRRWLRRCGLNLTMMPFQRL